MRKKLKFVILWKPTSIHLHKLHKETFLSNFGNVGGDYNFKLLFFQERPTLLYVKQRLNIKNIFMKLLAF